MKPRTLLILLVAVLGLSAFIWFYERELPSSEERTELAKKVLEIEKDEVTAVTIATEKGQVRLERVAAPKPAKKEKEEDKEDKEEDEAAPEPPAEWRITRPMTARADSFAVDQLLDSIASLEKTRTVEDFNRKDVGLDKPRATVRLATKEGERVLQLGAEVPPGGSLVAGLEGEAEAYVVSDTILSDLQKPPGDWRDRIVFRGDHEAIQRITLTGAEGGPVVLAKRKESFWIEKPIADRADGDLVDGMFSDLTGLSAERFLDGPQQLATLGLAPPRETVEVVFKEGAPVRVELGTAVPGGTSADGQASSELTYARIGNTMFEVRTRLAESTRRSPADWRALQLSALAVHDVESATVRDDRTSMQLTRSGTDWKRGDTLISYLPVSDLLFAVTGARADRLAAPAEVPGLAKPALTFTLRTKEAGEETLTLYPPSAAGVPARASGRDIVLLLPADTFREIQEKLGAVRKAQAVKPAK